MAGLNKMSIIGFCGRDSEVRYSAQGMAITNFSVAVSEKIKGEDKTLWFKIVCFGKLGELMGEMIRRGQQVYIEGRLQTSEWEDRDGNRRFNLEIVANQVILLGSKSDNNQSRQRHDEQKRNGYQPEADDDSIPF
jgi:single-strand DNA-binding protein